MIYCDSSFLCALYLPGDKYEPIARSIAASFTERFTPIHNCCTLDVLHVAAALLLEGTQFASFDIRQRKMATELSLEVFPDEFKKDGIA